MSAAELAPSTAYRRIPPAYVNTRVLRDDYRSIFEAHWTAAEQPVPAIHAYRVSNATVDLDGIVIDSAGKVLEDSIAECDISNWKLPQHIEREIDGPVLLLKKAGFMNYGHWMIEILPRVQFREQLAPDLPVFIHKYPDSVMRTRVYESLELAGIGGESIIEFEPPVRVRDLFQISPISKHNHMKSPLIASFLSGMADKVAPARAIAGNRLFLSRTRCSIRRVTNEDELFDMAASLGFRRVYTEDMKLTEQIRLFRSAEAIAGPLGAALTNIVFAPAETRVLILQPAKSLEFFFWDIACHRGQRYVSVHGQSVNDTPIEHYHGDFTVDPADFRAGLQRLLD